MPEVGTLEQLKQYMFDTITRIGDSFQEPDDDWLMVGAFEDREGQTHIGLLPNEAFASGASKDALAAMLKQYISDKGIVNYAILFNVHGKPSVSREDAEQLMKQMERGERIQNMDGSYEMLMLVTGNAGAEVIYHNKIERDGESPPKLTSWEVVDAAEFGGRFVGFNEAIKPIEI